MDQRKYGFANIVEARRGGASSSLVLDTGSSSSTKNKAVHNMNEKEVGMAMEVLQFVHTSLGGDIHDDLNEYYLGSSSIDTGDEEDNEDEDGVVNEDSDVGVSTKTAAAGRHSEGHYTQFIDDDPERGEGDADGSSSANQKEDDGNGKDEEDDDLEWDSDDEDDGINDQLDIDESVLVTSNDIQNAIRIAFRAPLHLPTSQITNDSNEEIQSTSDIISRRHRDAIDACSQLNQQIHNWGKKSSISIDWKHGVRVTVTSSLMMKHGPTKKNRFTYRIRVENIMDIIDEMKQKKNERTSSIDSSDDDGLEHRAVQLLGRAWVISERGPWHKTSSSLLQQLMEEGVEFTSTHSDNVDAETTTTDENVNNNKLRVVQTVNEPRTGAVGHLPVLGPGEVFEYMSGADIATLTGAMKGSFHMAKVDMQTTDSGHIGDDVDALTWKADDERRFEMPVAQFGLIVDEDIDL